MPRSRLILWIVAAVGGSVQTAAVAATLWLAYALVAGLPTRDELQGLSKTAQATVIFDRHDQPVFSIFEEQRRDVRLEAVSPNLVQALIAIEDQRFYEHHGLDIVRIAGATLVNLREGRFAQGGSTLTQQLARQGFLTLDKTLLRKVQEALLALRVEREFTKDQILELYLNKMYFGAGLYGAEAAALGYFGKRASALTVPEAALIAGLVKSPSTLAPTVNPDGAIARRNLVLQAMREREAIDDETYQEARAAKLTLKDALRAEEPFGLYFKEHVRLELIERFGREQVYEGGLKVYTTIDPEMQKAADAAVAASLKALDTRRAAALRARKRPDEEGGERLQAALVALDPVNGHVRALVGGRRFADSHFNRATQARRQPGSSFKPFVYAAALEAGHSPATLITDLDAAIDLPSGAWTPDDEHGSDGDMTMRAALTTSSNRAAVRMIETVGVPSTVSLAKKIGMGDVPAVPSLALGSGEVTLLDLTAAYGAFAAGGMVRQPQLLRKVEAGDGTVIYSSQPVTTPAVSPQTAFLMASMLADVINSGTAARARGLGFTLPAGGKTGTTNDYHDAWFVGFTPSIVSGVWVGYDTPKPILPGAAYAADVAVPLWTGFMKVATSGAKPVWFKPPPNITSVTICRLSGKRPSAGCDKVEVLLKDGSTTQRSMLMTEQFVRGTEPHDNCPLHVGRSLFARVGEWLGNAPSADRQRPAEAAPVPAPFPTPAPAAEAEVAEAPADDEPKKRGFWSRIFGRGKKADEPKKPKPE